VNLQSQGGNDHAGEGQDCNQITHACE
jgi:hypothetical protein